MKNSKLKETENMKESILVPDQSDHDHFSINMNHHEFHIEAPSSQGLLFLQDFDHDHQQFNGGSNHHNIMFGTTTDHHSFETSFQYNSSANNFEYYECKPFHHVDNNIMNTTPTTTTSVMDNFQTGGAGAGGYLSNYMALIDKNNGFDHQANKPVNFVAADEVSSSVTNRYLKKTLIKNKKICKSRKKSSNLVKGQWTIDEDRLLIKMVNQYGLRKWSHIAQILPERIGKQCRERWHNHLRPDIKKDTWSEEEDKVLIEAHTEIGNKWAEIAKRLPGRTENSIKNHWNATKRRQFSKRKCRSKYPRGSILQDYIKSLNLDNSKRRNPPSSSSSAAPKIPNHITATTSLLPAELNDRLVPNFDDFNEVVPDFDFDLQENCNIDSLLDEIPSPSPCVDVEKLADHQVMDFQVKKELDLMEMISQANL